MAAHSRRRPGLNRRSGSADTKVIQGPPPSLLYSNDPANAEPSERNVVALAAVPGPTDPYAAREHQQHHNEGHGRRLTAALGLPSDPRTNAALTWDSSPPVVAGLGLLLSTPTIGAKARARLSQLLDHLNRG